MRKLTNSEFLKKCYIHKDVYEYNNTNYINMRTKILVTCKIHGDFSILPYNHIAGSGCESCSRDLHKLTTLNEDRLLNINNIHKYYYQYNDMSIVNGYINICCPVHGTFSQIIYFHEKGHGCSLCNSTSRGEKKIKNYLENKNIVFNMNHTFKDCKNKKRLKFDFYLQNNNIIIEYDGEHHFKENKYFGIGNLEYITNNDNIKNKYCEDNNIEIIRIPYWNYNNIDDILDIRFYNFF